MDLFVQTRSIIRRADYRFLGAAPGDPWWREYDAMTIFEEATLLLEGREDGWRLYVTGIPSERKDSTGARIRFSIAADGDADDDPDPILALVQAWLAPDDGALGRHMDAHFDEDFVSAAYERPQPPEYDDAVRAKLQEALAGLPSPAAEPATEESWCADLRSQAARAALLARCRTVVEGGSGLAAVLNVAAFEDVADLAAHRNVAVLIPDGPPGREHIAAPQPAALEPVPGKAQGQGLTIRMKQTLATRKGKIATTGAGLTTIGIVVLILVLL